MKFQILAAFLLLSLPCVSLLSAADPQRRDHRLVNKNRLGLPFKTLAMIEVEIVRAEDVGRKGLAGQYLLRVSKVNGTELFPAQVFKFAIGKGVPSMPTDVFELYEQKTGKKVDELPQEEVGLAEKDFVGKKLTCLASELENPPEAGERKDAEGTSESMLLLGQILEGE